MDKPLLELKRFGRKIHLIAEKLAKEQGIESMAGPQGQVLHIVACRMEEGKDTLIKDIEQELLIFSQVMAKFYQNIESLENGGKDV
ncbi:hypothetical protein [Streptococcus sanguinis]|uniref:Multiple antibiotic resistance operon transcription repressor MarR n=1 Tax=Streptococcus sanguinis TaxID=1305 RepID=A0A2X3XGX6_STRSA|nr:hypothetical protein [Streptococcus sanguinis]EGJ43496.1 MarR family transcriptional regulator [Streptococcus sanguinis SK1059]EGQ19890.1 MarR family transcriptional regulator [Streptococcus sanguinis ATCC 29667]SQF33992.1 multiple antibiotic resistance operon transcription repressor MarR [Streptococcus sanguinis]